MVLLFKGCGISVLHAEKVKMGASDGCAIM